MRIRSFTPLALLVMAVAVVTPTPLAQGRATVSPANETATAFYLRYQAAITKATKMAEVLAFWSDQVVKDYNQSPVDQRVDLGGVKRIMGMHSAVKVVGETTTPTGATLTLEGLNMNGNKVSGTLDIAKENGAWKIPGLEEWQS